MLESYDKDYEVCNCYKITLGKIIDTISNDEIKTLGELQEKLNVGTDCRNCLIKEADFGKVKKSIYCKDILNRYKRN